MEALLVALPRVSSGRMELVLPVNGLVAVIAERHQVTGIGQGDGLGIVNVMQLNVE